MIEVQTTGLTLLEALYMALLFTACILSVIYWVRGSFATAQRTIDKATIEGLVIQCQALESELARKNDELTVAKANSW